MSSGSASGSDNVLHKMIAGVFAAVVAPVMVAFGIKFSDRVFTPADAKPAATAAATPATVTAGTPAAPAVAGAPAATTPGATAATTTAATTPSSTPPASAVATPVATTPAATVAVTTSSVAPAATTSSGGSGSNPPPSAPATAPASASAAGGAPARAQLPSFKKPTSQPVRLFNGRDLSGFYTYLGRPHHKGKAHGKAYDPDKVFSVQDGMIRVSGEMLGVLETEKEYTDYWLTLQYKWGEKTWPPDENAARRSAVLLNCTGSDGAVRSASPCSFHVQILEGATGEFLVSAGTGEQHYSLTAAVEERKGREHIVAYYTPGAPKTTFTQGTIRRYPPTTGWRDIKGFHPQGDIERPAGEWNTLECVVLNGKILVRLNDHVVNFAAEATPSAGRIALQSHGAEIFFRDITLQPYPKRRDRGE